MYHLAQLAVMQVTVLNGSVQAPTKLPDAVEIQFLDCFSLRRGNGRVFGAAPWILSMRLGRGPGCG